MCGFCRCNKLQYIRFRSGLCYFNFSYFLSETCQWVIRHIFHLFSRSMPICKCSADSAFMQACRSIDSRATRVKNNWIIHFSSNFALISSSPHTKIDKSMLWFIVSAGLCVRGCSRRLSASCIISALSRRSQNTFTTSSWVDKFSSSPQKPLDTAVVAGGAERAWWRVRSVSERLYAAAVVEA